MSFLGIVDESQGGIPIAVAQQRRASVIQRADRTRGELGLLGFVFPLQLSGGRGLSHLNDVGLHHIELLVERKQFLVDLLFFFLARFFLLRAFAVQVLVERLNLLQDLVLLALVLLHLLVPFLHRR